MTPARAMPIPAPTEVAAYAASIGFKLDGEYFCDYWAQRGWFVKPGIPMRDWRAAVRNWKRMDAAKSTTSTDSERLPVAEIRRREAAERQNKTITEAAERIRASMSWIKSGRTCPWSTNPQGEIDDEVAKIRDHYGDKGVDALRQKVKELGRNKP